MKQENSILDLEKYFLPLKYAKTEKIKPLTELRQVTSIKHQTNNYTIYPFYKRISKLDI